LPLEGGGCGRRGKNQLILITLSNEIGDRKKPDLKGKEAHTGRGIKTKRGNRGEAGGEGGELQKMSKRWRDEQAVKKKAEGGGERPQGN